MARTPTQKPALKEGPVWTPSNLQARFLAATTKVGTVRAAARIAKINETTHRRWMKSDPKYSEAFANAKEIGIQELEDEARRRAMKGSDTMLIFMLKAARPAIYRERVDVDHSGAVGIKFYAEAPIDRV